MPPVAVQEDQAYPPRTSRSIFRKLNSKGRAYWSRLHMKLKTVYGQNWKGDGRAGLCSRGPGDLLKGSSVSRWMLIAECQDFLMSRTLWVRSGGPR